MAKKIQKGLAGNFSNCFPALLVFSFCFFYLQNHAQGTWTPISTLAPDTNGGVMLLLSDGSVITKTIHGGNDGNGNGWDKLTPDIHGSYVNGTWSTIAPMHDTRLYFASQVLEDGRVFVAGGEYGTGGGVGETYDPLTDVWTMAPVQPGQYFGDANSETLPDGRLLVATLTGSYDSTAIFNPTSNTWSHGGTSLGNHDESAWVKLPDNSILFVDIGSTNSERYIPSLNQWIADSNVPVQLYDSYGYETGAGFLLPDGRVFFLGSTGNTAYYTPSGNNNPGSWSAGPVIPNSQGTPDAAAAMMVNGKILCAVSPAPFSSNDIFDPPTTFYEFDYLTNSFTAISAPGGGTSLNEPCYYTNMLDLPDGTVLFSNQDSARYYVYSPNGSPLAAGKPVITNVVGNPCDTFTISGTLFNGISEGAAYGDDWQMATNYPLVRLTSGSNVYYARTFDWNRTGVQTGALIDSAKFTLPTGLPSGTYSLVVVANGIASDPVSFIPCVATSIAMENTTGNDLLLYPNPAEGNVTISFRTENGGDYSISVVDLLGRTISKEKDVAVAGNNSHQLNIDGIAKGEYMIILQNGNDVRRTKMTVK